MGIDKTSHYNLTSYTIEDLKEYAKSKGGDCLSKKYTNIDKRYKWLCSEGHTWFASFHSVYHHNTWCPICAHRGGGAKGGIYRAKVKKITKKLQWEMVSYGCDHSKTIVRCQHGHEFKIKPSTFSNESKCPICEKKQLLLSKIMTAVKEKEGTLLSDCDDISQVYKTYVTCSCKEGHIFQISLNNLLNRGSWCQECGNEKRRIKMLLHHQLKKANKFINPQ